MGVPPLTKAEQEVVQKLKAQLNDIKTAANVSASYALWDIDLDQDSTDPKLDLLLVKFLRARYFLITFTYSEKHLIKITFCLSKEILTWKRVKKC